MTSGFGYTSFHEALCLSYLPMKSLVEEYFVLRTNAIQRRRFQNDQVI